MGSDKLKVAFMIQSLGDGAGQTQDIVEIIRYLKMKYSSVDLQIFTTRIVEPFTRPTNVEITVVKRYFSYLIYAGCLKKELSSYNIGYIKGNLPFLNPAIKAGLKTILVVHQVDPLDIYQGITQKLKGILLKFIYPYCLRSSDSIVTISDELAEFHERQFNVKCKIIGDPVGSSFYKLNHNTPDLTRIRLLSIGEWDGVGGRKRQDLLIPLLKEAMQKYGTMSLDFVGLSKQSIDKLRNIASEEGLLSRIGFIGPVSKHTLVDMYKSHDIYITHTTYEGFYRQLIEAFAGGMPALVYDSRLNVNDLSSAASVNHILKSGAGELFSDSESLKRGLEKIIENYQKYSVSAKVYSLRFTCEIIGEKTYELMVNLIKK